MQRDDTKQPYFVLAFSSSNHEPFEYPADAITPVEQPVHSLNNAVRYADHALGKFLHKLWPAIIGTIHCL